MHMLVFALLFEHHAIPCTPCFPCADPGFFARGGGGGDPGQSDKKSPDNAFFSSSAYFTEVKWLISKKTIIFQGSRGGPTFPGGGGGGPTFSRGSNCLYPIETHITCDFSGGSGPPDPPLDPHLLSRPAGDIFSLSRRREVFFSFI